MECHRAFLLGTVVCLGLTIVACGGARQPASGGVSQPTAELVLSRTSNKLAHAKQVTFKVAREFQTSPTGEESDDVKTEIDVALSRPDKLRMVLCNAYGI